MILESSTPTPYGIHCVGIDPEIGAGPCNSGQIIYYTKEFYDTQMSNPDARWKCPRCRGDAWWDDENYEKGVGL